MGIFMYYAVPAIVGALISIFMDKIAVHYIKVVLRSERMLESLENMVNTVNNVSQNTIHIREKCGPCSFPRWNRRLQELVGRVEGHRLVGEQRGFSRLNILSRYQRSKEIANLISDISKHLKLVPLVQLDCVLSMILRKRRQLNVLIGGGPGGLPFDNFTAGIVGWSITAAFLAIFFYMGRLRNFKKKLASFRNLITEIDFVVILSRAKISRIRDELWRANNSDNWLTPAKIWVDEMFAIIGQGRGINGSGSPIAHCKKSEQITELTSKIDAHLNKLSWITLDLIFHEIEMQTGPLTDDEVRAALGYSPQRPPTASTRVPAAPEEIELATSPPPPTTRVPAAPEEIELATSPPPPTVHLQGVLITRV